MRDLSGGNARTSRGNGKLHELCSRHLFGRRCERMHELRLGHLQSHHGWHSVRELRRGYLRVDNGKQGMRKLCCRNLLFRGSEFVHGLCCGWRVH